MMMPYGMMPYTAAPMQFAAQLQPQLYVGSSAQAPPQQGDVPQQPQQQQQQQARRGLNLYNVFQGV